MLRHAPGSTVSCRERARCGAGATGARPCRRTAGYSRPPRHGASASSRAGSAICPLSEAARPPADERAGGPRHQAALHASGRCDRTRDQRPERRRHHADRIGKNALLQRARPERRPAGPVESRAVLVSDESACAGPARRAADDVRNDRHRLWRSDRRLHVRRRYTAGRPPDDPGARSNRAEQSGHGTFGHPAASSAMGEALRKPALRRHRRAARLPRRLRQPSVQCPATAAPHLQTLRIESGIPLFVCDDCQPARAGGAPDGAGVRAGGPKRRAARREVLSVRQSAGRQPPAGNPALVPERDAANRV